MAQSGASQRGYALKGRRPSLPCRRPRRQMSERRASGAVKPSGSEAERHGEDDAARPQAGGTLLLYPQDPFTKGKIIRMGVEMKKQA